MAYTGRLRLQVYEGVGILLIEVYERVGKCVVWVCKRAEKGLQLTVLWLLGRENLLFFCDCRFLFK